MIIVSVNLLLISDPETFIAKCDFDENGTTNWILPATGPECRATNCFFNALPNLSNQNDLTFLPENFPWKCNDAFGNPIDTNTWGFLPHDTAALGSECRLKCKDGHQDSLCE